MQKNYLKIFNTCMNLQQLQLLTPNTPEELQKSLLTPITWSYFFSNKHLTPNTEAS